MRKRIWFVLCVILMLSVFPAMQSALAVGEEYSIIRVKLSVEASASLSFFVDGNYTIGSSTTAIERQQYTVKLEGGSLNMYCGSAKIAGGSSIKLVQRAATSGRNNFIWLYNARYETTLKYLGDIEFLMDGSTIQVVNHVYIEDYVCCVVPYEMDDSWPLEALKAQAVAARNYAAKRIGSSGSYDLTDNSSYDQVYKGYSSSATNTIEAVNATAGQVLTYGGAIMDCYYSSDNGGWTELPYHRWGGGADWPYYVISQDTFDVANANSPYETIFLPASNLETSPGVYTATTAYNSGSGPVPANLILYIKQCIVNSGQLSSYGVTDVNGFLLTGVTDFCTTEPFDVTYDDKGNVARDHRLTQDLNHDGVPDPNLCMDKTGAAGTFTVSVGGAPYTVSISGMDLNCVDTIGTTYRAFNASLSLMLIGPVYTADTSTLTGFNVSQRRFGHGVGLSQRGAQQRARAGQTHEDILRFYYPGTDFTTQTYSRPELTPVALTDHSNASVKLTDPTPLNVRSGPGTSYAKLGTLPDKARIQVVQASAATGNGYTWHKILFGGQYGYAATKYIELDDPQPAAQTCTVSFVTNGGGTVSNWVGNHGASISQSPVVSKTGYSFGGWYTDSGLTAQAVFPYIVTGDATLYAKWDITSYSISYTLDGGTATNPGSYTINDTITLSNPTRPGYSFTGWTGTGLSGASTNVTIPAGSTGNRQYTANWRSTVSTVTFDAQGGSGVAGVQKNPGELIDSSPATARPGYTFGGWYPTSACNTAPVSFPYTITGSVTLYAKWILQPQTAYLSSVSFSAGSLNKLFSKTSYSYKLSLGEYQDGVSITPFRENETATMTINGKAVTSVWVPVANGKSTTVTVKVKFGKTSKTYKFTVSRAKSTNNNLATLTTSAGTFDRAFDPAVTSYTLTLDEYTKSVKISDTVATSLASASFRSKTVTLSNGQTKKVTLTVKAQSGAKKTYTITVTRAPSTNTSLKYLKASSSSSPLTPAFSPGVTSYTITLPSSKSSVTISAATLGYKASVYFDGSKRSSKKVTLTPGQSVTIHITVVAQAGNTVDYYVTVTRL